MTHSLAGTQHAVARPALCAVGTLMSVDRRPAWDQTAVAGTGSSV